MLRLVLPSDCRALKSDFFFPEKPMGAHYELQFLDVKRETKRGVIGFVTSKMLSAEQPAATDVFALPKKTGLTNRRYARKMP
jgi:hypothetical protein